MLEPVTANAPAIEAAQLGIRYRRYLRKHLTLKEATTNFFRKSQYESFWALRQVSFTIHKGERVGVIGPNGSGKSTLVKAISRILPPAEGSITTHGRVVPLLELGGGFNPELTGLENIFLNAAIMGLPRKVIEARVEHIIDFAELGDFIDSPLHTYSSGMRARLGFAVASDIDPDILLLDEIFSVGDESFREKAVTRMKKFFESGCTILVVSHSLELIRENCDRVLYLRKGELVADGPAADVIARYRDDVAAARAAKQAAG